MPTSIVHLPAESLGGLKNRRRHPAGFIVDRDIHLLCSDLLSEIDTNFACPSLDSVIDVLAEWRGYIRRLFLQGSVHDAFAAPWGVRSPVKIRSARNRWGSDSVLSVSRSIACLLICVRLCAERDSRRYSGVEKRGRTTAGLDHRLLAASVAVLFDGPEERVQVLCGWRLEMIPDFFAEDGRTPQGFRTDWRGWLSLARWSATTHIHQAVPIRLRATAAGWT